MTDPNFLKGKISLLDTNCFCLCKHSTFLKHFISKQNVSTSLHCGIWFTACSSLNWFSSWELQLVSILQWVQGLLYIKLLENKAFLWVKGKGVLTCTHIHLHAHKAVYTQTPMHLRMFVCIYLLNYFLFTLIIKGRSNVLKFSLALT